MPPPPEYVVDLLGDLERYIQAEDALAPLVRIAIIRVQFETIHPYLDGNGRLGRMLIALLLEHWGLLKSPLRYLSHYFKQNQAAYYRWLGPVRTEGGWKGWLNFFLIGVAENATDTAQSLYRQISTQFALASSKRLNTPRRWTCPSRIARTERRIGRITETNSRCSRSPNAAKLGP